MCSRKHGLHIPKEEWLELPAMAIKCTFWGLNFVSNDIALLASKLDEIYNQTVVARVKASLFKINIFKIRMKILKLIIIIGN